MQWIFIALLFVCGSLILAFLQQIMRKTPQDIYCPPSAALIDQVLPEEIFEHVLSFSDPITLVRCNFVNKYWNYQASKSPLRSKVLQGAIIKMRNSLAEVPQNKWLEYSVRILILNCRTNLYSQPEYPIVRRLSDFALAEKFNRQLLELKTPVNLNPNNRAQFFLKTICSFKSDSCEFDIYGIGTVVIKHYAFATPHVPTDPKKPKSDFEVVVFLHQTTEQKPLLIHGQAMRCRPIEEDKYHLGLIPLDKRFLKVMCLLLLPIFLHDVLDVLNLDWFMNAFGTVMFGLFFATIAYTNKDFRAPTNNNNANYRFWQTLNLATIGVLLIGFIVFYPASGCHVVLLTVFGTVLSYGYFVADHCLDVKLSALTNCRTVRFRNRPARSLFFVILALVLLAIDYTMVYKSILDRTLFYRIFWNTMHWALVGVYCIWNNVLLHLLWATDSKIRWKYFIQWQQSEVELMAWLYVAVVFVTLWSV